MILSDRDIMQRLALEEDNPERLIIEPFLEDHLQPASYDITLGNDYVIYRKTDEPIQLNSTKHPYHRCEYDQFRLHSKQFALATTLEYIEIPNGLTAQVQGRSSLGRLGLFIQNAGWIDPGFKGQITLELYNASRSPIILESGVRIGQLIFAECKSKSINTYGGKYSGQKGTTPSRIFMDFKEKENGKSM